MSQPTRSSSPRRNEISTKNKEDVTKVKIDKLRSPQKAVRVRALKFLSKSLLEFDARSVLSALDEHDLATTLFRVAGRDDAELCRELASTTLRDCARIVLQSVADGRNVDSASRFVRNGWTKVCELVAQRLSSSNSGKDRGELFAVGGTCAEPSEEIRLRIVQTVYSLLHAMSVLSNTNGSNDDDAVTALKSWIAEDDKMEFVRITSDLVRTIHRDSLIDPFPDLKRESCRVLVELCDVAPRAIRLHCEGVLRPLTRGLSNSLANKSCLLRHRHAATRSLAVTTAARIVECVCENDATENRGFGESLMSKYVIPSWTQCSLDKSVSVRLDFLASVGKLAGLCLRDGGDGEQEQRTSSSNEREKNWAKLLVFLLGGLPSDCADVSQKAREEMSRLALKYATAHNIACDEDNDDRFLVAKMVHSSSASVVPELLHDSNEWMLDRKLLALSALRTTLNLVLRRYAQPLTCATAEEAANWLVAPDLVEAIARSLCASIMDDEVTVKRAAASCSEALGQDASVACHAVKCLFSHVVPTGNSDVMSPVPMSSAVTVPLTTARHVSSALSVLGSLFTGTSSSSAFEGKDVLSAEVAIEVSNVLTCRQFLDLCDDDREVAWSLFHSCKALLRCVPSAVTSEHDDEPASLGSKKRCLVNVLRCLAQTLGCPAEFEIKNDVMRTLDDMSEKQSSDEQSVLDLYFRDVTMCVFRDFGAEHEVDFDMLSLAKDATKSELAAFESVVRHCDGSTIGKHFDIIAAVLETHLHDENVPYQVKFDMMGLLESVVSTPNFPSREVHSFTTRLMRTIIVPNLVWRVGGQASALRKLSAAALFSLLRANAITPRCLDESATRLFPVLKTNLGDDDVAVRHLTCLCSSMIIETLSRPLDEDAVRLLYPCLLKCLDDNDDRVRSTTCDTVAVFLRCSEPSALRGTVFDYVAEQLLLHMDDPNPAVQTSVLEVLKGSVAIDRNMIIKKVSEARSCHRSSEFCDALLDYATKK